MDRRKHPRVDVTFKVALAFSGGRTEGGGRIVNLSEGGCAVQGDKRVPERAMLNLSIFPPGRESPIVVPNAAVRWVRGWEFGVEFVSLSPELSVEIKKLLEDLKASADAPPPNAVGRGNL